MKNDTTSRSWFCVFNNPADNGFPGLAPEEVLEVMKGAWEAVWPDGACALSYCVSAEGLHHVHAVLEGAQPIRFSAVQKAFPGMHIEPTKGSKRDAEDYIKKIGRFAEKGETVVCSDSFGEIRGCQGARSDFSAIQEMIDAGMRPEEIMAQGIRYRKYEKIVRAAFFSKRKRETPRERDVAVFWHVGPSGSGKSHSRLDLMDEFGEDEVYVMTDYDGGGLDRYAGERILFMDEFRGQIKFNQLLTMLDRYVSEVHCRYSNTFTLWDQVHITSVLPPEKVYESMVGSGRSLDSYDQLKRRIKSVVYHECINGKYLVYEQSMEDYTTYSDLILETHRH